MKNPSATSTVTGNRMVAMAPKADCACRTACTVTPLAISVSVSDASLGTTVV